MLPFLVVHVMNLIHQGTQLPQGTCGTERSVVRKQLSELPCQTRSKYVLSGKEKIGTGSKTIYDHHKHKNHKPGRKPCSWMIWRWWSSNNDSHHSFVQHLLAPVMCENLYWALEYGTEETLDLSNDVYTGDKQFQSCGKCGVRRNMWCYMSTKTAEWGFEKVPSRGSKL